MKSLHLAGAPVRRTSDTELVEMLQSSITDSCYPDKSLRTLTIDVGFYISRIYSKRTKVGYWWLNANPNIWSFSDLNIGETKNYMMYSDNGGKRRVFQNFLDAKAGDMVIGYASSPVRTVVAIARASKECKSNNTVQLIKN